MRADEEYTRNAIKRYLNRTLSEFTITEGEDPPDYYVNIGTKKILLEITAAEGIYAFNDNIDNRKTVDVSLLRLCDQINDKFESRVSEGTSLLLYLKGPVLDFRDFKKALNRLIEQMIGKDIGDSWHIFDVCGETVKIKNIIHDQKWQKKIIGAVDSKGAIPNIQLQTQLILNEIIKGKEAKTKIINGQKWNGEKWLGILNNYFLANPDNFIVAMNSLNVKHGFTRIFLVYGNSEVVEILNNNL